MRVLLPILFCAFNIVTSTLLADEMIFPVYSENQPGLIVSTDYAEAHKADFAKSLGADIRAISFWTPTLQEIDRAQMAMRRAVDLGQRNPRAIFPNTINGDYSAEELQREQVEMGAIGTYFDRYARQYVGVILGGKRRIFCNFVDPEYSDKKYADFSNDYAFFPIGFVRDLHVLQAYYDPETTQCLNFTIIGPWSTPPGRFVKVDGKFFVGYIIPREYAEQSLGYLWGRENVGYWQPTEVEVERAYIKARDLLAKSNDPYDALFPLVPGENESDRARVIQDSKKFQEIGSILAQWKKYEVQFVGVVINGKRKILCNFVLSRNEEEDRALSRFYNPGVPDSGTCTWRIVFDVESNTFSGFETCGYA